MNNLKKNLFDLTGRVAIITGGTGLLGQQHAEAIASAGGIPVLADICLEGVDPDNREWKERFGDLACAIKADITQPDSVKALLADVLARYSRVDILINNAANNPKMENKSDVEFSRLEFFPLKQWEADIAVGLTGAFLCSQIIGSEMARRRRGVIVNVASDLAVIAPDQRLYRQPGLPAEQQPVKPVTYSVVKTGLIGLTRYLATYWAEAGIRVNAVSPGGVYNNQPEDFVQRLTSLIPLGRMANANEYQAAILYLCSDASSYMTGTNLVIDGGRSCW
ncbi:MAG: SDR family oxidoreductase [Anaerolineales bacterium]|nr:SDR family oxidoreductase [Anaerolineales bacterium]MDP3184376.1 SDR family oxidoreductase [Anaerolineales bacterium]